MGQAEKMGRSVEQPGTASASVAPIPGEMVEQFVRDGFCYVPRAFSEKVALRVCEAVLEVARRGGTKPEKPNAARLTVSRQPGPPFTELNTPAVWGALDQLMGKDRYQRSHFESHGNFLLAFPGFSQRRPRCQALQWHVDHGFNAIKHYRLDDGNCGIIPIFALTPVRPHGGPTLVLRHSHRWIARLMKHINRPIHELEMSSFCRALARQSAAERVALIGEPGDLILVHPLMVHTASPNHLQQVRVICNTGIAQLEDRCLDPKGDISAVERAIVDATSGRGPDARDCRRMDRGVTLTNQLWRYRSKLIGSIGVDTRRIGAARIAAVAALDLIIDPVVRGVADLIIPEPAATAHASG